MDRTSEFNKKDIEENKGIAAFAYFGISFIMPLWGASDSPFARFDANQGMVLALNELIVCILILVSHLLVAISPLFRYVRTVLWFALVIAIIFYSMYGMINAIRGKAKELPFIGSIKIIR